MKNWTQEYDIRLETRKLVSSHTLKRCPLCGAVNSVTNDECFVCCWRGGFDTRPGEIEEGVQQLFDRCPELAMAIFDRSAQEKRRRSWLRRAAVRFAELLRGHRL